MNKLKKPCIVNGKKQHNALLTFSGEQDAEFFSSAIMAACELSRNDSGGSREVSVRCENGNIVLGFKKELDV